MESTSTIVENEKTPLLQGSKQRNHESIEEDVCSYEGHTKSEPSKGSTTGKNRRGTRWKVSVACILLTEMCERMTYYSVASNMVIFCTNVLLYSSIQAVTISLSFTGACFIFPVVGGWMADSVSGRYNTIYGAGLLYIVGSLVLVPVAIDYVQFGDPSIGMTVAVRRGFYMTSLVFIAAGTSGLKANVSPFGAEQVAHLGNDMIQSFFSWFYWFINLGAIVSLTVMVYIQQEISFSLGYLIAAVLMIVSIIFFILPRSRYRKTPPAGSVLTHFGSIIYTSLKLKSQSEEKLPWFLDYASDKHGGPFPEIDIEGIRSQIRMLPVFMSAVMYSVTYSQLSSTFILQGERLNLQIGNFTVPVASLSLFNTLVIMVAIPLMDRVILPLLSKCKVKPSQLQRVGLGFTLGAISVAFAGWLEIARKNDIAENGLFQQEVAGVMYNASHMSVFWQVPQYVLSGTGEIFAAIAGLEFAYSQAPKMMVGVTMGLYLVTLGVGALLGSALLNIVNAVTAPDEWLPDEINNGHLEYYFFLLCGLTLFVVVLFTIYTRWYFTYASYSIEYAVTADEDKFGSLESGKSALVVSSDYEADTTGTVSKSNNTST